MIYRFWCDHCRKEIKIDYSGVLTKPTAVLCDCGRWCRFSIVEFFKNLENNQ